MELGQQSIVNAMLVDPMAPEAQDGFHDQMHVLGACEKLMSMKLK